MSFTCEITGSCWTMSKNALSRSTSWNCRARVAARSKRKPSTCISVTQYRSESMISCSTCGCRMSRLLPGAGGVVVVRAVAVDQAVVGGVVDAPEAQRRAEVVALGGVVVDDVEDDLDARLVQGPDHRLELLHLLAALARRGVRVVRGEEADGVVAPVVRQALVEQRGVLHELVDGHELDRRDAQVGQVLDHAGVRERGVRAADVLRDAGVRHGQALDVGLVDHRLVVLAPRRRGRCPSRRRG